MKNKKINIFQNNIVIVSILLVASFVLFSIFAKGFFSTLNMNNLLVQMAVIGIVAVGQAILLVSGCVDLSQGRNMGICTVFSAMLVSSDYAGLPWWAAIISCIGISLLINVFNGFMTAYVKLPAFIVTLGASQIVYALALIVTNGRNILGMPKVYSTIATTKVFGFVPAITLVTLVVIVFGHIILSKTTYGRKIYATGSNIVSAKFSGVPVEKVRFVAYLMNGLLVGLAAFIMLCRINSGIASNGNGYEMNAMSGAVIGGASMNGGKGSVIGAILGAALMVLLTNGLQVWGVNSYIQQFIMGVILILAILIDTVRSQKEV